MSLAGNDYCEAFTQRPWSPTSTACELPMLSLASTGSCGRGAAERTRAPRPVAAA
jgi:hypothetical protein